MIDFAMQNEILKRFDIIKNAIAIGDIELIAMQMQKLKSTPLDENAQHIFTLISTKKFQNVIELIDQYRHEGNRLVVYEDPQIHGLKLELQTLNNRLIELTEVEAEIDRKINEFNTEYMRRLGDLIDEILRIQIRLCDIEEDREEAERDYADFEKSYQHQMDDAAQNLTDNEKQQLKNAFRQASRLCHPDKLSDEFKERGEAYFKKLINAYRHQDLHQVETILHELETGTKSKKLPEEFSDKQYLQNKIEFLNKKISHLEAEITDIQNGETYQLIQQITDFEIYFSDLKKELKAELRVLKADLKLKRNMKTTI